MDNDNNGNSANNDNSYQLILLLLIFVQKKYNSLSYKTYLLNYTRIFNILFEVLPQSLVAFQTRFVSRRKILLSLLL